MKKEQRETIKKYEQEIKLIVKPLLKKYGYKSYSNAYFFKKENDYFIHGLYDVRYLDGRLELAFYGWLKKYSYDNLFWEIINMSDNVNTPDRFRANGAFVCPSYDIVIDAYEIDGSLSVEELLDKMINSVEMKAYSIIEKNDFLSYIEDNPPKIIDEGYKTLTIISYIESGKIKEAYHLAKSEHERGVIGGFINEEKTFNEWAMEYCLKRMS